MATDEPPALVAASTDHTPVSGASSDPDAVDPGRGWFSDSSLNQVRPSIGFDDVNYRYQRAYADLLSGARLRPRVLGVLVPTGILFALVMAYLAATLLWPISAIPPTYQPKALQNVAAPPATFTWPEQGSAAVAVTGMPGAASNSDRVSIASITKVVTAMLVLDRLPLQPGEQGPEYSFDAQDDREYRGYLYRGESALGVPVGGVLTEYQLLQGMLMGSANNYAERLREELWDSDAEFASAARDWLTVHGIVDVRIVEPTGFDVDNTATAEGLLPLAQEAMANPVFAEIVGTKEVELPGAGLVHNTNPLLEDPGVVGIKTGTLLTVNLLAGKDIAVTDGLTVRAYASVLGQTSYQVRAEQARSLFDQLAAQLQLTEVVPAGTQVGTVDTVWGETAPVVTTASTELLLWNGAIGSASSAGELNGFADDGTVIGAITVVGPSGTDTADIELAEAIDGPSPWWRLTHPLELFGLAA